MSSDHAPDDLMQAGKGLYQEFFDKNKEGITHCDPTSRTYFIRRGHTLRGPIPPGLQIEYVGLANQRRAGHVKQRRGNRAPR